MPGDTLTILSTLGVMEALRDLGPRFEAEAGIVLQADYAPTKSLLGRIAAGEAADVAFLTADAVDDLMASGTLLPGSRTDLARSFVGVAVREGAPRPDIGSAEAFVATLRAARSIAYSRAGASGIFFAGLIRRLGIEAEVNAKATIIPEGLTGALVARGEAEIAIQQVSELMAVPRIDILGRLPEKIAGITTFSGAVFAATGRADAARALLAFLTRPGHRAVFAEGGLEPVF